MLIMVEGLPQTGKSTLCRELSQALGIFGWFYTESFQGNICQNFKSLIDGYSQPLLLLHGSHLQFVAQKDKTDLSLLDWSAIDDALARSGAHLILLQDDPFKIEERLRQTEKTRMTREQIGERQNYLNNLFESSTIPSKGRYMLRQFIDQNGETTSNFEGIVNSIRSRIGK